MSGPVGTKAKNEKGAEKRKAQNQPRRPNIPKANVPSIQSASGNRAVSKLLSRKQDNAKLRQEEATLRSFLVIESIKARLNRNEETFNNEIQNLTRPGVNAFVDDIDRAAHSFDIWFKKRTSKFNTTSFLWTLAQSIVGIVAAYLPPVGRTAAWIVAGTREKRRVAGVPSTLSKEEFEATDIRNMFLNFCEEIKENYQDWGKKLRELAPDIWYQIAIDLEMLGNENSGLDAKLRAQELLYTQGGVPHPDVKYADMILYEMIRMYLAWEVDQQMRGAGGFPNAEKRRYILSWNQQQLLEAQYGEALDKQALQEVNGIRDR